jgi:hypothetical protein
MLHVRANALMRTASACNADIYNSLKQQILIYMRGDHRQHEGLWHYGTPVVVTGNLFITTGTSAAIEGKTWIP